MRDFVNMPNTEQGDWGGVHFNSGIANRAFFLAAASIGKPAWEVAGKIWYRTLTDRLRSNSDFQACANNCVSIARDHFDDATAAHVAEAWVKVGVIQPGSGPIASLNLTAPKAKKKKKSIT